MTIDDTGLSEMLCIATTAKDSGFTSVQIDASHAIELCSEVQRLREENARLRADFRERAYQAVEVELRALDMNCIEFDDVSGEWLIKGRTLGCADGPTTLIEAVGELRKLGKP